ncbi:hypothetical protein C8F04DRAFT_1175946 [Mycena alexandri]|uniref:Uncharacterized protein n=1 Tax=Mycena alexandri TaxID=1745969 RepID=A0AAD6TEH9_9AGAR|nr:hypothetical protein C8F04DRAFT_1175946 [Mycena alexandri]
MSQSQLQDTKNTMIPDPRLYWESSVGLGWYYRHPVSGAIGPDTATFVPPQTAPTPANLLARFLSQDSSPASTIPAAVPAPQSPGIHLLGPPGPSRAGRARGGFQFQPRGNYYHGGQTMGTQRRGGDNHGAQSFTTRPQPRGGRGGMSRGSRASRQYNPVSSGGAKSSATNLHAPMAQMQIMTPLALASPAGPTAPFVAIPPPDVTAALRNADGHPAFPHLNAGDAPMEDVVGVVQGAQTRADTWHRTETTRIENWGRRLQRGDSLPRAPMAIDPARVGVWATLMITSVAQAQNLMRWSDAGCPYAWAMILFLQQDYGLRPLAYRSAGVGIILSSQAGSLERYTRATQGVPPVSRRAARRAAGAIRALDPHTGVTNTSYQYEHTSLIAPSIAAAATPAAVVVPPDAVTAPIFAEPSVAPEDDIMIDVEYAFLGTSPAGDDAGDFNSRVSVEDADAYWVSVPTALWPKALRNIKGEFPKLVYDLPFTDDSRVVFTMRIFGPTTGIALDQFTATSMTLFSCTGLFEQHCTVGGYHLMSRGPEHYNFVTTSLDWSQVASWWCTHGIVPGSPAVLALESFARSYRNQLEGHHDPENVEFVTYPNQPSCVKTHPNGHITRWKRIEHGMLYGSLQSTYPRRPSELLPGDDEMDGRKTPTQERLDWSLDTDPTQPTKPLFKFGSATTSS